LAARPMQKNLRTLAKLLSMSRIERTSFGWAKVYRALGTRLPSDYVDLIDRFGGGWVNGEMAIHVPGCKVPTFDLVPASQQRIAALAQLWISDNGESKPAQLGSRDVRLIVWGSTGMGVYLADSYDPFC